MHDLFGFGGGFLEEEEVMVEFDDFEGEFAFVEHVGGEVFLGFELVDDRWGGLLLVMGGGLFLCKN